MKEELELRMDRTAISICTLADEGDGRAYWQSKVPEERLRACEVMRPIIYGYDPYFMVRAPDFKEFLRLLMATAVKPVPSRTRLI